MRSIHVRLGSAIAILSLSVIGMSSVAQVGIPAQYPSSSPNVISVGGTTLNFVNGALSSETGWSGSGGG